MMKTMMKHMLISMLDDLPAIGVMIERSVTVFLQTRHVCMTMFAIHNKTNQYQLAEEIS